MVAMGRANVPRITLWADAGDHRRHKINYKARAAADLHARNAVAIGFLELWPYMAFNS